MGDRRYDKEIRGIGRGERVMVELTASEAESLADYLETFFIQNIRDNIDLDSMLWLDNMMSIWRKCGGRKQYGDAEDGE